MKYVTIDGLDRDDLIDSVIGLRNQLREAIKKEKDLRHEIGLLREQLKDVESSMSEVDFHTLDGARILLGQPNPLHEHLY